MATSAISTTLLCLRMLVLSALILIGHYITIINPKGKNILLKILLERKPRFNPEIQSNQIMDCSSS